MNLDFSQVDRRKLFRMVSRVKHLSKKSDSLHKRIAAVELYLQELKNSGVHDPYQLRHLERKIKKLKEQLIYL